jgi:hypothetical protein
MREAWKPLRLPDGPPPSRPLDPIEELMARDGIEIAEADRTPQPK